MTSNNGKDNVKREDLECLINDAAEGLLNSKQIINLEEDLLFFPDLHRDYREIMQLPDLSAIYGEIPDEIHVMHIQNLVQKAKIFSVSFEETTIIWFRKYALAAFFLIFGLTSLTHYFLPQPITYQDESTLTDIIYPNEENITDAYVIYLDEMIE
ncbi:MAG: hypothetical protein WD491_13965 [Balneolales bacterium]